MKLYNAPMSPNAIRVRALIDELGLDVEIVDKDMRSGEMKEPGFLALNPNGKVPVLELDDGSTIWESRAIMAYLAAVEGSPLYPADPRARAEVDQWQYWHAVHFAPTAQAVFFERRLKPKFGMGEPDESKIEKQVADTEHLLDVLEEGLTGKDYVAGELSLADLSLACTIATLAPAGILLAGHPALEAWHLRLMERASVQKEIAPVLELFA
ncbi:glutathione S-transferase family protein [Pseudoroseicyclus tamaricis]|uniref:Glutathione S-transferase family protein n=1 Tax=Pseudoroseicyclus tamaricis TaxID=2705421 RepID=A0A6B2JRH7_9RHOB|nr:glutathione S-transferase family protein [Pseudoroseicyclus tamaricis]NDV00595.1 glutathione S-transferase family protein [Pseudoroseicyclus tamaricis]